MSVVLSNEQAKELMAAVRFINSNRKVLLKPVEEQINEEEACRLLGITRQTLSNYISKGQIAPDMYSIGVGGNKFFYKQKLMNVKNQFA